MYSVISKILNFILVKMSKSLYVIGKDNIPKDSKYVVTCTHESYNEVIMLGMALYPNQIHYMAKKNYSKINGLVNFNVFKCISCRSWKSGPSTLKRPINLLKDNKTVGIFPTGSRTSQEGAPLKRGASTIAMLSKSPILPVAYVGPTKIHGLLTGQAYINIGKPIDINDLPKDLKRNRRIDYITKRLKHEQQSYNKNCMKL